MARAAGMTCCHFPCDLGEALVSYLRRRGPSESRTLFLKVLAPAGPMSGDAISGVIHAACVRAGIPPVGPHRLRHTAATGMLAAGASLAEIGQVGLEAAGERVRPRPHDLRHTRGGPHAA